MNLYKPPGIVSGAGVAQTLTDLPGRVLAVTMEVPWKILQDQFAWHPQHVHMVTDMDLATVERLDQELPPFDIVVGIGGGSCCDTAKYLAWRRNARMILVPTIISVDAPLANTVAVRVNSTVQYVGDIFPEELLIDYDLIQQAPPELNRAGACDIASIHTALYDWRLAHEKTGEKYDEAVAAEAADCLRILDENAEEVYAVTPKGIDTIVDLYRREVEFCAHFGNSRPEEGSEHLVAYHIEHLTRRHFLHGDLVGLGIFTMAKLQENRPEWALDLLQRCGLRFAVADASLDEIAETLRGLRRFKDEAKLFYSVVDVREISEAFVQEVVEELTRFRA